MSTIPTGAYVVPGWPRGFCPRHVGTSHRCHTSCLPLRREFAVAAHALDALFAEGYTDVGHCAECKRPLRSGPHLWRSGMRCQHCARKGNRGRMTSRAEWERRMRKNAA